MIMLLVSLTGLLLISVAVYLARNKTAFMAWMRDVDSYERWMDRKKYLEKEDGDG